MGLERRSNNQDTSTASDHSRPSLIVVGCIVAVVIGIGILFTSLHRSATPIAASPSASRQNASSPTANAPATSHIKPGASKPRDATPSAGPGQKAE